MAWLTKLLVRGLSFGPTTAREISIDLLANTISARRSSRMASAILRPAVSRLENHLIEMSQ